MWKRRFSSAPVSSSRSCSGWTSPRPFTGEIEIWLTDGTALILLARLDLYRVRLQFEDVEVAAGHVDGDVVHGSRADCAFEAASMSMAVEDDVGPVLGDRRCQPVTTEVGPDAIRL